MEEGGQEREEGKEKYYKAFGESRLVATFQSKFRLDARNKGEAQRCSKHQGVG